MTVNEAEPNLSPPEEFAVRVGLLSLEAGRLATGSTLSMRLQARELARLGLDPAVREYYKEPRNATLALRGIDAAAEFAEEPSVRGELVDLYEEVEADLEYERDLAQWHKRFFGAGKNPEHQDIIEDLRINEKLRPLAEDLEVLVAEHKEKQLAYHQQVDVFTYADVVADMLINEAIEGNYLTKEDIENSPDVLAMVPNFYDETERKDVFDEAWNLLIEWFRIVDPTFTVFEREGAGRYTRYKLTDPATFELFWFNTDPDERMRAREEAWGDHADADDSRSITKRVSARRISDGVITYSDHSEVTLSYVQKQIYAILSTLRIDSSLSVKELRGQVERDLQLPRDTAMHEVSFVLSSLRGLYDVRPSRKKKDNVITRRDKR